jgi:hypothetical protein
MVRGNRSPLLANRRAVKATGPALAGPADPAPSVAALALPAAIAVLALALRLWRIRTGLPEFLDEAIPFRRALDMWGWETGRTDLNPHFFHYPTLTLYLQFLVQKLGYAIGLLLGRWHSPADWRLLCEADPTAQVVPARLIGMLADAATVWAVWRIGERLRRGAGWPAALLVAFAPGLIATSRAIYADTVMVALLAWSLERLLAWRDEGRRGQLVAAVILGGLAAGAKYTAGSLVLPLAWVLFEREGARGLRRWPLVAGSMLGVFLLTSPYIALDVREFWRDFSYEGLHMSRGHLGTLDRTGAGFSFRELLGDLGPAGIALLLF